MRLLFLLLASSLLQAHRAEVDDESVLLQVGMQVGRQVSKHVDRLGRQGHAVKTAWPKPDDPNIVISEQNRSSVKWFKDAVDAEDIEKINISAASMAIMPVELDIEENVYDYLFYVLDQYKDPEHQYIFQQAWRGLSDQSATLDGSHVIANFGGPNKGVQYMVKQLLAHPLYYGYCEDQCTTQYEILACLAGLLEMDNNNTRGPAAVEVGLVAAVMRSLMGETILTTQATACRVMSALFWRSPDLAEHFSNAGAVYWIDKATEKFKDGDDTPFYFGMTLGDMYNISVCEHPKAVMNGEFERAEELKQQDLRNYKYTKPWITLVA